MTLIYALLSWISLSLPVGAVLCLPARAFCSRCGAVPLPASAASTRRRWC